MSVDGLLMLGFILCQLLVAAFYAGRAYERWSWQLAIWRAERLGQDAPEPYRALRRYSAILVVLLLLAFFLPR